MRNLPMVRAPRLVSLKGIAVAVPDWIYKGAYPVPAGVINPDPW